MKCPLCHDGSLVSQKGSIEEEGYEVLKCSRCNTTISMQVESR